jgi:YidC/Oxa1 family membrane protein insertase
MAEMKKLTPRMQALKERYSEDKKKFSEALMRMYKEEKVNPLGGCPTNINPNTSLYCFILGSL